MKKDNQRFDNDKLYHVINRSISKYQIFNNPIEFENFLERIIYYQNPIPKVSFSNLGFYSDKFVTNYQNNNNPLINIVSYCIMPTHFHLILKQNCINGISIFIGNLTNSYTKYFNVIHKRKGPLWVGRFKAIDIQTDEQLLHLTRYIHLNPCSAGLVTTPEDWHYSSYDEYVSNNNDHICIYSNFIDINKKDYKIFCHERIDDQRELSIIKSQIIENYSG